MQFLPIRIKSGRVNGLKGYYSNASSETSIDSEIRKIKHSYTYERIDPQINFVFYERNPVPGVALDNMIIRWEGFLDVPRKGRYKLFIVADDGARVYLDQELVIDAWRDRPLERVYSRELFLQREIYRIEIEYYNTGVFGKIELGWKREGGLDEIIPSHNLFTYSAHSIIITNPPRNAKIKIVYNGVVREAFIKGGIALIPIHDLASGRDSEGRIVILDESDKLIYMSPIIEDMSPGDIYSLETVENVVE
ncbi:MAG: PA14 domain-containing protein [Sulfolobales archaeon]